MKQHTVPNAFRLSLRRTTSEASRSTLRISPLIYTYFSLRGNSILNISPINNAL